MSMRFVPHPYQTECIERIKAQKHIGLWLDMGLGKTVITLSAIKDLIDDMAITRVLVIAPLTVAETVWTTEVEKWDHLTGIRVERVLGSQKARRAALAQEADIYVVNRENVSWVVSERLWRFDAVVIDELSSFKSHSSKRFKALRSVLGQVDRIIGLTGTPSPNGLMDLWAQTYLLDRGERLGRTLTAYRTRYFTPGRQNGHVVYDWRLVPGAEGAIYKALSDLYVSVKNEIPIDRVDIERRVSVDLKQYKRLKDALLLDLGGGTEIAAPTAAALMNKLLQICNGSVYDENGDWHALGDEKLVALDELIEAADDNMIVYYRYRADLERIMARHPEAVLLRGEAEVRRWNAREIKVLLAHPASAGYGLNLQAGGSIIVWYGLPWSLELYQQANARLARQGQKKTVRIVSLLAAGTVDEQVRRALEAKDTGQRALLEALRSK